MVCILIDCILGVVSNSLISARLKWLNIKYRRRCKERRRLHNPTKVSSTLSARQRGNFSYVPVGKLIRFSDLRHSFLVGKFNVESKQIGCRYNIPYRPEVGRLPNML